MGMGSAPAAAAAATLIQSLLPSFTTSLIMGTEYLAAAKQAEFNSCSFDSHTTLFVKDGMTINY
jgi:hypothetical protein